MTPERKKLIRRLRKEGSQAFLDGKHEQTNPYRDMDAFQWYQGYDAERRATWVEEVMPNE